MKTMLESYLSRQEDVRLLYSYVEKVGLHTGNVDGDTVNQAYCRLIFKAIVTDYQQGLLSVHDLSSLCELMWQKCEEFSDVLLEGAEMNWYLRWSPQSAADALSNLLKEFGSPWENPKI